jgi:hypothetical protein
VTRYAAALREWRPDLVLGNIPYLPLAAAARCGIPAVALSSFSWDVVLAEYFSLDDPEVRQWWEAARGAYADADVALRIAPGRLGTAFRRVVDVPPVVDPVPPERAALRERLGVGDSTPVVLLTMGGIQDATLPLAALAEDPRITWLVSGRERPAANVIGLDALDGWTFQRVAASVDAVVGKLGYNTTVQAAVAGVPVLYVRRTRFPDEAPLAAWLHEHAAARELTLEQYRAGRWHDELRALWALPRPPRPRPDGASRAAQLLLEYLA